MLVLMSSVGIPVAFAPPFALNVCVKSGDSLYPGSSPMTLVNDAKPSVVSSSSLAPKKAGGFPLSSFVGPAICLFGLFSPTSCTLLRDESNSSYSLPLSKNGSACGASTGECSLSPVFSLTGDTSSMRI